MADHNGIRDAVKANAGRADAAANTNAVTAVDRAQRLIESERNWYWMEYTATAVAPASGTTDRIRVPKVANGAPADFKELRGDLMWDDTTAKVRKTLEVVDEDRANYLYNTDDSGDPEMYRLWRDQFYLYPPTRSADATIRIPYWGWSPAITGTDTNELSLRWPDLWIARATAEYFKMLRQFKEAAEWFGELRNPRPGTYLYELNRLTRYENSRKVPRNLGAWTGQEKVSTRTIQGYPFWGR